MLHIAHWVEITLILNPGSSNNVNLILVLHHDSPNVVFDGPTLKSFRDRHRFLDSIYNSYPRPEQISAKALEEISKK